MTRTGLDASALPQAQKPAGRLDKAAAAAAGMKQRDGDAKEGAFAGLLEPRGDGKERVQDGGARETAARESMQGRFRTPRSELGDLRQPASATDEAPEVDPGSTGLVVPDPPQVAAGHAAPAVRGDLAPGQEIARGGQRLTASRTDDVVARVAQWIRHGAGDDAQVSQAARDLGALGERRGDVPAHVGVNGRDIALPRPSAGVTVEGGRAATTRPVDLTSGLPEAEPLTADNEALSPKVKGEVLRQETHFAIMPPQWLDSRPVAGQILRALTDAPSHGGSGGTSRAETTAANASAPLRVLELQLQPAALGTVRLHLTLRGDRLTLRVSAAQAHTLEMLQRDQTQLQDILRDGGIQVDTVTVVKDADRSATGQFSVRDDSAKGQQPGNPSAGQSMGGDERSAGGDGRHLRGRPDLDGEAQPGGRTAEPDGRDRTGLARSNGLYL